MPATTARPAPALTLGLFARLEAKPGKEDEVVMLLRKALEMAKAETSTPLWFAVQFGPTTFAIFDAFSDEAGRRAHLEGPIAQALMTHGPDLLARDPGIERLEIIGAKVPR